MGLQERGDQGTYVSIANGKIVQTFKDAGDKRVQHVSKEGKVSYRREYDSISGMMTGFKLKQSTNPQFSDQYIITLEDEGQKFFVNFYKSSRVAASIMKALPNVDLEKPVVLYPWKMQDSNDKTKEIQGVTIYQKDRGYEKDKVPPAYTKDAPNGLPQMKKIKVKGKEQWDSTDMDEFLEKMAMEKFKSVPTAEVADGPSDNIESPF